MGSSNSPNTTTANQQPPQWMQAAYGNLINEAGNVATKLSTGQGQQYAGLTPQQQLGMAGINSAAGLSNPYFVSGAGYLNSGMQTANDALHWLPQAASMYGNAANQYGAANNMIGSAVGQYGAANNMIGNAANTMGGGLGVLSSALPYYGTGAGFASAGAGRITPMGFSGGELSKYMSPYTQNVIDTSLKNIQRNNQIQTGNLTGSAIMGGNAFGGDRAGVAQAELARNQDMATNQTIAGLENQNYAQALGEFNTQQGVDLNAQQNNMARMLQAAGLYGSLGSGVAGVGQGIAGIGQGLGGLAGLQSNIASGLGSLGGLQSNIAGGLGNLGSLYGGLASTQGGLGGLQAGIGSQLAAMGPAAQNAALQAALAQMQSGGVWQQSNQKQYNTDYANYLQSIGVPSLDLVSKAIFGTGSLSGGTGTTTAPSPSWLSQLGGLGLSGTALLGGTGGFGPTGWLSGLGSSISGGLGSLGLPSWLSTAAGVGGEAAGIGLIKDGGRIHGYADGGDVDERTRQVGLAELKRRMGGDAPWYKAKPAGWTIPLDEGLQAASAEYIARKVHGYADGGNADDGGDDDLSFADRAEPVLDALASGDFDPQGINNTRFANDKRVPVLPPSITGKPAALSFGDEPPEPGLGTLAFANASNSTTGDNNATLTSPAPGLGALATSPAPKMGKVDPWMALAAAGFGMMSGTSPFGLVNVGRGGLAGLQNVSEQKEQMRADLTIAQRAQQLAEQARQHAAQIARETARDTETGRSNKARESHAEGVLAEQINQHAAQIARETARDKETARHSRATESHAEDVLEKQREQYEVPAGYRRTEAGTLEAIPGGPHDPKVLADVAKAKMVTALTDNARQIKARQVIGGDMSALTNVGRGAQGSAELAAIANEGARILTEEMGYSAPEAAAFMSKQLQAFKASGVGQSAEARTAGTREANLNLILKATEAAIPAALEASDKLGRTGFVPLNKIIQSGQVLTSNPELREFGMANLQLAEHWARAMNPTGVMRESDRDKALGFLSTADSPETYRRVVLQLQKQIQRERDAVASSRPAVPGGAAPSEAHSATKPAPTQKDIDYARAHPEVRELFITKFGREP